ncbi:MAG: hypothetical protein M0R46_09835 [Candidatus Muirbacterium halophilum]|nr:hypothetical protein [Candidatus Muirbacterium halophilum]
MRHNILYELKGEHKREASFSRDDIDNIIDYLVQRHNINTDDIQKVVELTDFGTQSIVVYLSKKYNIDEPRMVHLDFIDNPDGISIDFRMPDNIVKSHS